MLFLDEQNVRYVGITSAFLNSLVLLLLGVKCTMAGTIAIVVLIMCCSNSLQWRQHTLRLRMDFDFDFDFVGINGTVSCWLWTSSEDEYVGILVHF